MEYGTRKVVPIPLHGLVDVSDYLQIVDSKFFQRLRGVRQLDMASICYPGAIHTRFEHSVGTMETFRKMFIYRNSKNTDMSRDELAAVELTALLHDTPHNAYAHLTGVIEQALTGKTHDDRLLETVAKHYEKPMAECGFSVKDVQKVIESQMKEIIWEIIGVDKLDYIPRDLYHIGYPPTNIEPMLKYSVYFKNRGFCIEEKNVTNVRNFITDYCTSFKEIYWRKSCMTAQTMMRRAILDAINKGSIDLKAMPEMRDEDVDAVLKTSSGRSQQLFENISNRRLYKAAIAFKIDKYSDTERTGGKPLTVVKVSEGQARKCVAESRDLERIIELEVELSKEMSADIIISTTPDIEHLKPRNPKVYSRDREEIQNLSDVSKNFFDYQKKTANEIWVARIVVPEENRRRVSEMSKLVKDRLFS